jgi:hypothetical protein
MGDEAACCRSRPERRIAARRDAAMLSAAEAAVVAYAEWAH